MDEKKFYGFLQKHWKGRAGIMSLSDEERDAIFSPIQKMGVSFFFVLILLYDWETIRRGVWLIVTKGVRTENPAFYNQLFDHHI